MKAAIILKLEANDKYRDGATSEFEFDSDEIHAHLSKEPTGTQWRTIGFKKPNTVYDDEQVWVGKTAIDTHIDVVIIERIMPSATIKKEITKVAHAHFNETGEQPNKAMVAQWKEKFLEEALPHAPLKETIIRVSLIDENLIVGTSSHKVSDDVLSLAIRTLVDYQNIVVKRFNDNAAQHWLDRVLYEDGVTNFELGNVVKLYDISTKRKVTISNDDALSTVLSISSSVPHVSEIQLIADEGKFNVSNKGVFKGIKPNLTREEGEQEEEDLVIKEQTKQTLVCDLLMRVLTFRDYLEQKIESSINEVTITPAAYEEDSL